MMPKRLFITACLIVQMAGVVGGENSQTAETLTRNLSSALQQSDWPKIELAARALGAAELNASELELAVVRAERDAALGLTYPGNCGSVKPLGQAARFLAGNRAAIEVLHQWAYTPIPEAPPPDPALWADRPLDAIESQKAQLQALTERERQEYAFVALAYLKDPALPEKALAALKDFKGDGTGCGAVHIVEALLTANTPDGIRQVLELCADREVPASAQAEILGALTLLSDPNLSNYAAAYNLTLATGFQERLPKDLRAQVLKLYVAFLQRLTPGALSPGSLFAVVNIAGQFTPQRLDANVLAALKGLRTRTQDASVRREISQFINQQRSAGPKDF